MSLESLNLAAEPVIDSWDDVPQQQGPSIPTLPRGEYQLQLPHNLLVDKWAEQKIKKTKDGVETEETYYRVNFDADFPLVVTATNVEGVEPHALFRGSISTMPRPRFVGKRGDPPKQVSDAVYLYRDGLKGSTVGFKPSDHKALVAAICKAGAGKEFVARVIWPAFCNKKKIRYIVDAQGQNIEDPEGKFGCGENYRDGKTIDAQGVIAERFTCKCGASLRVFAELAQFRAVEGA